MTHEKKILIIVPAYNEGAIIRQTVTDIKNLFPQYPILVVNDGSSDNTAEEAALANALVISHPYNLGIGGAIQTGFKYAKDQNFDIVVQMDGDAQHDPHYLQNLLTPVINEQLDLCIGSRFLTKSQNFRSTSIRRIGIRFFAILLGLLTGSRITDPTSGYRATSKPLINKFARFYPLDFPEPEAIQMATRFKAKIGEVPVRMRERTTGSSSIRYLRTFYYMIKVTLAILIDTLKRER